MTPDWMIHALPCSRPGCCAHGLNARRWYLPEAADGSRGNGSLFLIGGEDK